MLVIYKSGLNFFDLGRGNKFSIIFGDQDVIFPVTHLSLLLTTTFAKLYISH